MADDEVDRGRPARRCDRGGLRKKVCKDPECRNRRSSMRRQGDPAKEGRYDESGYCETS